MFIICGSVEHCPRVAEYCAGLSLHTAGCPVQLADADAQALRRAMMSFLPGWAIRFEQCGDDYAEIILP